jgi:hypothetical protein
MKTMIAYCGLDCEKCDAYLATIHDDRALREKTAKLWSELNQITILPEQIDCEGCRADGRKTVYCDRLCQIRRCAIGSVLGLRAGDKMFDACHHASLLESSGCLDTH